MHNIEPFHRWLSEYDVSSDTRSPFFGKEYNYDLYTNTIYGYYIDPGWDFIGSETLYIKILYADYERGFVIMEMIGEWNDALHNDIMHLKRNIVDQLQKIGINQFILIGENVMNFHGSDDCYYEEWFEDVEDGWIALVGFRDFVLNEMTEYNIDSYLNYGGNLQIDNWRTMKPQAFHKVVDGLIMRRLAWPS
ncbi:hypothetical protein [Tunicatimonas pelagia]|uniref:hypothetical protein n=1 Tax=Tunicatimonas pelagia TaxID=931531 RepID=UPI00266529F9|nr:hypothetical protein [Tunicatimonas pelagia]WKN41032.1 hypothetical protein P0M28_18520 [Tunicatimonas pelagia]